MALTLHQRVKKAEEALKALELSVTTNADRNRISQIWSGMRALDEEQCAIKYGVANLIDSLVTGYTEPEVIEDLRGLVKEWDREEKSRKAERK